MYGEKGALEEFGRGKSWDSVSAGSEQRHLTRERILWPHAKLVLTVEQARISAQEHINALYDSPAQKPR